MLAHREKKTASGPLHVSSPPHRSCFGKSLSYPPLTTRAHRRCDPRNDFPPGMYFKFKESPYPSTFPKTSCFYLYKSSCVFFFDVVLWTLFSNTIAQNQNEDLLRRLPHPSSRCGPESQWPAYLRCTSILTNKINISWGLLTQLPANLRCECHRCHRLSGHGYPVCLHVKCLHQQLHSLRLPALLCI
jgi:hypothetical protein